MNRRLLATLALLALMAGAGCLGQSGPSDADLSENASYDWNTSMNVSVTVEDGSYKAVYNISNKSRLDVYSTDALGGRVPLEVKAVKFRHTNGTVVNASAMNVSANNKRTRIGFPADEGQLAFTVEMDGKELILETFVDGSYAVTLPERTSVDIPILANIDPGGFNRTTVDGQTRLQWKNVESDTLAVRYYLDRDLFIFGGLGAIGLVAGVVGSLYYYRKIRNLKSTRESVDVDIDDDGDDPPPGMG